MDFKNIMNGTTLLYTGLKVKLKSTAMLFGETLEEYQENGFAFITKLDENGDIYVSSNMGTGLRFQVDVNNLIPVYEGRLEHILSRKERELKALEREIENIRNYIKKSGGNA